MSEPVFSVVMPAHNAAKHIKEAIESVLAQGFELWELIVVDDGSDDGTDRIATAYSHIDERVRVVRQSNSGTATARNTAIAAARGKWCLMLDADDMLKPECMSIYADFLAADPSLKFVSCYIARMYPSGRIERHRQHRDKGAPEAATLASMFREVTIVADGTCVQTTLLRSIGGFNTDSYTEDLELWFHLLLAGCRHRFCPKELAIWRVTAGSKSSQSVEFAEGWVSMLERLDGVRINELGVQSEFQGAVRQATSRMHLARLQDTVLSGHSDGCQAYLRAHSSEIDWTLTNTLRVFAALAVPVAYGRWLRRGGRRDERSR